jgi:hypothetical protein
MDDSGVVFRTLVFAPPAALLRFAIASGPGFVGATRLRADVPSSTGDLVHERRLGRNDTGQLDEPYSDRIQL